MKIELHKIADCGFYERGASSPLFGRIDEWLPEFRRWVDDRSNIVATKLSDDQEVYCAGSVQSPSGFGLKLWNATPSTDSGVAYISMADAPDGRSLASEQDLPDNSIPGWPSFFWILPDAGVVVTLLHAGRIRNRGTAIPQLRDYLSSYMKAVSPYVNREIQRDGRDVQESVIHGYQPLRGGVSRSDLFPRFSTTPVGLPPELDFIRAECMNIRKMVSSMTITRAVHGEVSMIERMLNAIAWDRFRSPEKDVIRMHWETDWEPSPDELEDTISRYCGRLGRDGCTERVGVKLKSDSRTYWFDSIYAADEVQLPNDLEGALDWNRDQFSRAWKYAERHVVALQARM